MVGVLDHLMLAALEPPEELLELGVGERHMRRAERRHDLNARTLDSGAAEHRTVAHAARRVSQSASTSWASRATKPETPYRFQSTKRRRNRRASAARTDIGSSPRTTRTASSGIAVRRILGTASAVTAEV